jgi:hypothetical protein
VHLDFLFLVKTQLFDHFGRLKRGHSGTEVGLPVLATKTTSAKNNDDSLWSTEVTIQRMLSPKHNTNEQSRTWARNAASHHESHYLRMDSNSVDKRGAVELVVKVANEGILQSIETHDWFHGKTADKIWVIQVKHLFIRKDEFMDIPSSHGSFNFSSKVSFPIELHPQLKQGWDWACWRNSWTIKLMKWETYYLRVNDRLVAHDKVLFFHFLFTGHLSNGSKRINQGTG